MNLKQRILGIAYEDAFWRSLFWQKNAREGLINWSRYGQEILLDHFDAPQFLDDRAKATGHAPLVADVGCGASFCTGNKLHGQELNMRWIDPLADRYNRILAKHPELHLPQVEFGMAEHVSALFPQSDVDLIHIQNALDHSEQPVKSIIESLRALAIGGKLYLKHFPNEAEKENYRGFHQFNVDTDTATGHLIIWNDAERHDINTLVEDFATIELHQSDIGEIIAILTKTAPVPQKLTDDTADIRALCERQTQAIETFDSFWFCLKYHLYKRGCIISQCIMRFFSPQMRQRVKDIFFPNKRRAKE